MQTQKPKVIISACLLGHLCRYDGKTKIANTLIESLKEYEIIPFCPEAPLFGTPRERINVIKIDDKEKIITDISNKDVTQLLEKEINSFIQFHPKADKIILKSKSPSCGINTTPVLDKQKNIKYYGNGIAANMFIKHYINTSIKDETQ